MRRIIKEKPSNNIIIELNNDIESNNTDLVWINKKIEFLQSSEELKNFFLTLSRKSSYSLTNTRILC